MFKRVLIVLVLISIPAWGDTLRFGSLASAWIEGSAPGSWNGFNAWFLDNFEATGGPGGVPTGGAGDFSNPFLYSDSRVYLQGGPGLNRSCGIPSPSVGNVCASLELTNTTGYFSDPSTFYFNADVSGRLDPLIYTYFSLPEGYLDAVGELSFALRYGSSDQYGTYFGGFTESALTLHPVPEPSTLLLLGAGIAGVIARNRRLA